MEIQNALHSLAVQIRDEQKSGANTANRVGSLLVAIVDALGLVDKDELSKYFLRKDEEDTAKALITFLAGIQFGSWYNIDGSGNALLKSLTLESFLEVPELRYNKTSTNVGNRWNAPGGGLVESVYTDEAEGTLTGIVTLHLEDGEMAEVEVDDICMGIFHNSSDNEAEDSDDGYGNFTFAGFQTVYFRVTEILDSKRFRYALRGVSERWRHTYHPTASMNFVAYGNFTNKDRQQSVYETKGYTRFLTGVNDWEFGTGNIAAQFGCLDNLRIHGLNMEGYSAYLNNIYMSGTIQQFEDLPLKMEIDSNGDNFLAMGETVHITCKVTQGFSDVTGQVSKWTVTRDSGNQLSDESWALRDKAKNFAGEIDITLSDDPSENDLSDDDTCLRTLFTFRAELQDGTTTSSTLEI
jgi:hypothetical protein